MRKNSLRNNIKGSATIEAALIFPIVLFITYICIWFSVNFTTILIKQYKVNYNEKSIYDGMNPTNIHRLIIIGSDVINETISKN